MNLFQQMAQETADDYGLGFGIVGLGLDLTA